MERKIRVLYKSDSIRINLQFREAMILFVYKFHVWSVIICDTISEIRNSSMYSVQSL